MLAEQDLNKYNAAAKIAGDVFRALIHKIQENEWRNVKALCDFGTSEINAYCDKIYKQERVKGVAFPTCISLNDCVDNYIYDPTSDEYNTIKDGDVVKVNLGVNIGGCIAILGETLQVSSQSEEMVCVSRLLSDLAKDITKMMKANETNDEVRMLIESKCSQAGVFPVENSFSYQHKDGQVRGQESKYMVLNHKKYWDEDDTMVVDENVCYEFQQGEVYTINLAVVRDNVEHIYKEAHIPHVFRFNDYFHGLKLKSAREFFSRVKSEHGYNAWELAKNCTTSKDKLGVRECVDGGILEGFPVLYCQCSTLKQKIPVYHKKFTVLISEKKAIQLKYD
jgi:methionine aminopeptidase